MCVSLFVELFLLIHFVVVITIDITLITRSDSKFKGSERLEGKLKLKKWEIKVKVSRRRNRSNGGAAEWKVNVQRIREDTTEFIKILE